MNGTIELKPILVLDHLPGPLFFFFLELSDSTMDVVDESTCVDRWKLVHVVDRMWDH